MVITKNALNEMETEINKKYYSKIKVISYFNNKIAKEQEIGAIFHKGDTCNIEFNGILLDEDIPIKKKWWQFWE